MVLRTKGIVPLSTRHGTKNLAPLAPWPPHRYLSKLGGGGGAGGCRIQGPGPAAPPPPGGKTSSLQGGHVVRPYMNPPPPNGDV